MFFSYRFLKKSQKVNSLEAYIKFKCNKNLVWLLTRLFIIKDILFSPIILLNIFLRVPKLGGESQLSRISKK